MKVLQFQINSAPFCFQKRIFLSKVISGYMENEEGEEEGEKPYNDVPRPGKKGKRKPYATPMKVLIRRAKEKKKARQENPCQILEHAPENGLLVPELIEVAHQVHLDRSSLLHGLSKLIEGDPAIPIHRCRFCPELHVGWHGHEIRSCEGPGSGSRNSYHVWRRGGVKDIVGFAYCYHLFDRVGKPRVGHKERLDVPKLPAILELCIQAGLNLDDYPTKRRIAPVYSIDGRIVDFETHKEDDSITDHLLVPVSFIDSISEEEENMNLNELAMKTLRSCSGWTKGTQGEDVQSCKASVSRWTACMAGSHYDDLIKPNFVWHVKNPKGPPLANVLKRYYGKAPAVVELCVQAGAPIPKECSSMMRLDVILPDLDEYDLVS
ncbi:hypothetical protein IEQ34_019976 [Dendrobium chrysotoxum]|uniref:APO domain-containing protein n=1 Tax=Dendrobium chrysotoxum TaxID=161865 RepID=A0AAV7GA81_DENCH|nr:hypothetical protein IEQ34_019976 [Dendrobium chrysotoxum]